MTSHAPATSGTGQDTIDVQVSPKDEVTKSCTDNYSQDQVGLSVPRQSNGANMIIEGAYVVCHEDQHEEEWQEYANTIKHRANRTSRECEGDSTKKLIQGLE